MLIYVRSKREGGKRDLILPLYFPTILLANHLLVVLAWLVFRKRAKAGERFLTLGQALRLLHVLWWCKLRHPLMPLAEVKAADGTRVRIRF